MAKPKLLLIDGHSLGYRAFFALPPTLATKDGQPTNAIHGFASMLIKILTEEKPDYIAVAFDLRKPTFRNKEYKEYKAHRPPPPPEYESQVPIIKELIQSFDIAILEKEGYEADDIIGTLSKLAEKKGIHTDILTGDLDALQLVSDDTYVFANKKGISDILVYNPKQVNERYGLTPYQMIDFKAIKGDPSDNIPGIAGLGEKTAIELIKTYGTLEEIIENVEKIEKASVKEKIKNQIDIAKLSKKLVTIVTDIKLKVDFEELKNKINWAKVINTLTKYEIYSLIKRIKDKKGLPPLGAAPIIKPSAKKYHCVTNKKDFESLLQKLKKGFVIDLETTSFNAMEAEIVGIALSYQEREAYYIPVAHKDKTKAQLSKDTILKELKLLLEDESIPKYAHNAIYETVVLNNHNIILKGLSFDTIVASYVLDPTTKHGLKPLVIEKFKIAMTPLKELIGTGTKAITMAEVLIDQAKDYACADADFTMRLVNLFQKELNKEKKLSDLYYNIELPMVEILSKMEINGVKIDVSYLKEMSEEVNKKIKKLTDDIHIIAGEEFNINSTQQLGMILFEKLQIQKLLPRLRLKKTKTGYSTDASVLEKFAHHSEIVRYVIEYRLFNKLKNTYIDTLPNLINKKTKKIHASFNQTITATGRLSSSNPNLQNIPIRSEIGKYIRQAFTPSSPEGYILSADYSQIELRLLAHLTGDSKLIQAFKEGKDIHRSTAAEVFGVSLENVTDEMRSQAKAINFGIAYGMQARTFASTLNIPIKQAQDYIDKYFRTYKGIKDYIDETIKNTHKLHYTETILGRRRNLTDITSENKNVISFAERVAINTPMQGSAADIIKIAMINIQKALEEKKLKTKMIIQVHDELVFDVPKDELEEIQILVQKCMEEAYPLNVPLKVNIIWGQNWLEAK